MHTNRSILEEYLEGQEQCDESEIPSQPVIAYFLLMISICCCLFSCFWLSLVLPVIFSMVSSGLNSNVLVVSFIMLIVPIFSLLMLVGCWKRISGVQKARREFIKERKLIRERIRSRVSLTNKMEMEEKVSHQENVMEKSHSPAWMGSDSVEHDNMTIKQKNRSFD